MWYYWSGIVSECEGLRKAENPSDVIQDTNRNLWHDYWLQCHSVVVSIKQTKIYDGNFKKIICPADQNTIRTKVPNKFKFYNSGAGTICRLSFTYDTLYSINKMYLPHLQVHLLLLSSLFCPDLPEIQHSEDADSWIEYILSTLLLSIEIQAPSLRSF